MKTLFYLSISLLLLSGCAGVNSAHKDSDVVGSWSGLVRTDCSFTVIEYGDVYKVFFYQGDKVYSLVVDNVLDNNIVLPDGYYMPYTLSGKFVHPTPTTMYFNSVDTLGNNIELGFVKVW